LQLASLNLGDVYQFPYVEAPDSGMIRDGYKLLFELGAVNKPSGEHIKITKVGRQMAHLPIDPRLGRMLLAAKEQGVVEELLVIVSALSIQDVRERPMDKQQASDQKHSRFKDAASDFVSLLKLWDYYHDRNGELSQNQLRKLCRREFLSYMRLREWNETYRQLRMSLKNSGELFVAKKNRQKPKKLAQTGVKQEDKYAPKYDAIHRSLLTGLLSNIGFKEENQEYQGANNRKFYIFPASGLRKSAPKWIMAAEIVETSRLFARTVAKAVEGFVVLDTAPSGHTLLLLDAAESYHREVSKKAGGVPPEVQTLLPRLRAPSFTKVLMITLPDATPVHEAKALQRDLSRAGISVTAWVVNQSLTPLGVRDPVLVGRRNQEQRWIAEVQQISAAVAVVPWGGRRVHGRLDLIQ